MVPPIFLFGRPLLYLRVVADEAGHEYAKEWERKTRVTVIDMVVGCETDGDVQKMGPFFFNTSLFIESLFHLYWGITDGLLA